MPDLPRKPAPRKAEQPNRAARRHAPLKQPDELMTCAVAARRLKVHHRTIRRWIAEGKLPGFVVGTRSIRVRKRDVEAMVHQIPTVVTI